MPAVKDIIMKYELTTESRVATAGATVYRIKALRDIPEAGIRAGDLGGFVESASNLSQAGNCWVSENARVYGNAHVYGNALVTGNAKVSENAKVYGDARVYGDAMVCWNAKVFGNARVSGNARVTKTPISIDGLRYQVTITDSHLIIGCQIHTPAEWEAFTDDDIARMDGERAIEFWGTWKRVLLDAASRHCV